MRGFFTTKTQAAPGAALLPRCGACGLADKCRSPKLQPGGGGGAGVLYVDGNPDHDSDRAGTWFAGAPGAALRATVRRLGHRLEDGWHYGATVCHAARGATAAQVDHCEANITQQLRELRPVVVVPLGPLAVRAVVGPLWRKVSGIQQWAGWSIPVQAGNYWVCPTWHPQHVAEADHPVMKIQHEAHIAAALEHTARPWDTVPDWRQDVQVELSPDAAAVWLQELTDRGTGVVAFDYETTALKPEGDYAHIVAAAVTWGDNGQPMQTLAFPWHGAAVGAMSKLLRSPIPKIAANLKFEDRWTRAALGHRVRGWCWDTMLAAHVDDPRPGITGLKFQAFVRLGMPPYNTDIEPYFKSLPGQPNRVGEIPVRDLLTYCGLDALLEFRLAYEQAKAMGHTPPGVQ